MRMRVETNCRSPVVIVPPAHTSSTESKVTLQKIMSEPKQVKFLLVGSSEVGKTTLLQRYMGRPYLEKTAATVGIDFQVKEITW